MQQSITDMRSKFRIDFGENPDVRDAFSTLEPGDEIDIEVTVQVSTVNNKYAEGDVMEVRLPETEETEPEEEQGQMTEEGGPKTVKPADNTPIGINVLPLP